MQLFDSVTRWISDMPVVRRARNGPRAEINEQILLRVIGDDATGAALLRNLSIGGACIRCDLHLSRGDLMWIRANEGSADEFELTAAVVAVRPSEMGFFTDYGLRIVELSLASAQALGAFINIRLQTNGTAHRDTVPR